MIRANPQFEGKQEVYFHIKKADDFRHRLSSLWTPAGFGNLS
jgi:hypothetical protein